MTMLSVRLVTLDHYMGKPVLGVDSGLKTSACPVLRLFGPTSTGLKACVHVHGVYPYLYVPYEGGENVDRDCLLLTVGLDRALQAASGERASYQRFVHSVTLVSGIPLYGYHPRPRQFMKIYFMSPYSVKKAADLLLNGAILNKKLQPHESHIPFTQQFMIDYNLFGMSYVNFAKVKYRRNPHAPDALSAIELEHQLPGSVPKLSHSFLEVDVLAEDILNRLEDRSSAANPGLAGIWAEERERRQMAGRTSLPTPMSTQSRPEKPPFGLEADYLQDLKARLAESDVKQPTKIIPSAELETPYPAEVQNDINILDASTILDLSQVVDEAGIDGIDEEIVLVNKAIVHECTQRVVDEEQDEGEAECGRGEGAESEEDEEGPDMTQPLDAPTALAAVRERSGELSSDSEEEFWKEMAEHIYQLDGAVDSSDPSDDQRQSTNTGRQWQDSTSFDASDSLSNIMSILGETDCLTGFPTPQMPTNFWENNASWEQWSWNCPTPTLSPLPTNVLSPPAVLTPASQVDSYSEFYMDNMTDLNMMQSPLALPETPLSLPPPSVREPSLDVSPMPPPMVEDEPKITQKELHDRIKKMIESRSNDSVNNSSLTLREYLKNLGDIVRVDFRVINDTEMVVIEYRPSGSSGTQVRNRFLIKPLFKFIEEWNIADFDAKRKKPVKVPKYINGFTPKRKKVEKKGKVAETSKLSNIEDTKKIVYDKDYLKLLENKYSCDRITKGRQRTSSKFVVKTIQILDEIKDDNTKVTDMKIKTKSDSNQLEEKTYSINESVISKDKITLKLVKSRGKGIPRSIEGGAFEDKECETEKVACHNDCFHPLDKTLNTSVAKNDTTLTLIDHSTLTCQDAVPSALSNYERLSSQNVEHEQLSPFRPNDNQHSQDVICESDIKTEIPDKVVVEDLNNKFEDFYHNFLSSNKTNDCANDVVVKSEYEVIDICDSSDEEEKYKRKLSNQSKPSNKPDLDPVKFVSELLSTYSSLPHNGNLPPLSITVNIGDLPVQVNMRPLHAVHSSMDGPNDPSSDDSSDFRSESVRDSKRKKAKYKPLKVVVQKSPQSRGRQSSSATPSRERSTPVRDVTSTRLEKNLLTVFQNSEEGSPVASSSSACRSTRRQRPTKSSSKFKEKEEDRNLTATLMNQGTIQSGTTTDVTRRVTRRSAMAVPLATDICGSSIEKVNADAVKNIPQTDAIGSSSDEELCSSKRKPRLRLKRKLRMTRTYPENMKSPAENSVNTRSYDVIQAEAVQGLKTKKVEEAEVQSSNDNMIAIAKDDSAVEQVTYTDLKGGGRNLEVAADRVSCRLTLIETTDAVQSSGEMFEDGSSRVSPQETEKEVLDTNYSNETIIPDGDQGYMHSPEVDKCSFKTPEARECKKQQLLSTPMEVNDAECLDLFPVNEYSPDSSALTGPIFRDVSLFGDAKLPVQENQESVLLSSLDETTPKAEESSFILAEEGEGAKCFIPGNPPPSIGEVISSLHLYNLAPTTGVKPFYSDYRDVTKQLEVGNKVLKVESRTCADLKIFKSSLGIFGLEEHRKVLLGDEEGETKYAFIKERNVEITPLIQPPSRETVEKWLSKRTERQVVPKVKAKTKLLMPGGIGSDSEEDVDTLTPCTPGLSDNSLPCTPASTPGAIFVDSPGVQPLPEVTTPLAGPSKRPPRRVSFDEAALSKSNSPTPHCNRSTPISKRRSVSPNLPTVLEGTELLKTGLLGRVSGRRRLIMLKVSEKRRASTDSNRSTDMFETAEDELKAIEHPIEDSEISTMDKLQTPELKQSRDNSCIIQGVSLNNTFGFKASLQNLQQAKPRHDFQLITVLTVEVLTEVRGDYRPDPQLDSILAIFYSVAHDSPRNLGPASEIGVLTVGNVMLGTGLEVKTTSFPDETTMIKHLVMSCVRDWDPDILIGYEIEQGSWGYILQRGCILGLNLLPQMGRTIMEGKEPQNWDNEEDTDVVPKFIRQLYVPGRIVMDAWRLLRKEIALTSYTFENVMFHLLHERHPLLPLRLLSHLWQHRTPRARYIAAEYFLTRLVGLERILVQLDLVARTSELARLFGIQFMEVLTRGSQFRVESMMLRLAKPLNYVPVSPSITQRAQMRAPASVPMIMEPESQFYSDPVIVLDFQSLYPSMIIGYNYCFSTCLGRISNLGRGDQPFEFGCTRLSVPISDLHPLTEDNIHVSPAGVAFVKTAVRKGVLPAMLEEILDTRLMVKRAMKEAGGDKVLYKMLHARQLGLKLIANVTYGYTAANFSGRMPCIEVGDSVVSKGRETLQRAIRMVENTPQWRARVVYGDTDSLFVLTPGRTREEAFRIGAEIADAVTMDNPPPVKLKLEKVYQPCILQTKKRYVGYMYESPSQVEPVYDAKGIETVRRDGCPAVAKVLQKALHILFDTSDVSLVKKYCVRQFAKLFQGRVNLQDLVFAKEYRGRKGYRPGACVPALQLARQWTSVDKRAEPRKKERVPYVIVHGAPGVPLIRLVRSPKELLTDSSLRIHAAYYITKALIPPLQRCFTLLGADPLAWYTAMPRRFHRMVRSGLTEMKRRQTISQYFAAIECVVCGTVSNARLCVECLNRPQKVAVTLMDKSRKLERAYASALDVCKSCCGRADFVECESLDCPVLFRRHQLRKDEEQTTAIGDILKTSL